jgi:hypothetical protein
MSRKRKQVRDAARGKAELEDDLGPAQPKNLRDVAKLLAEQVPVEPVEPVMEAKYGKRFQILQEFTQTTYEFGQKMAAAKEKAFLDAVLGEEWEVPATSVSPPKVYSHIALPVMATYTLSMGKIE